MAQGIEQFGERRPFRIGSYWRMIVSMAGQPFLDAGDEDSAGRLNILGIGIVEERLYRALLSDPRAPVSALAASIGVSIVRARHAVRALRRAGMLSTRAGHADCVSYRRHRTSRWRR